MPDRNEIIEESLQYIQENRSNEGNFDKLNIQLDQLIQSPDLAKDQNLLEALKEIKEKQADAYQIMKEKQGSAWPEFEKFVAQLEKSLIEAKNT